MTAGVVAATCCCTPGSGNPCSCADVTVAWSGSAAYGWVCCNGGLGGEWEYAWTKTYAGGNVGPADPCAWGVVSTDMGEATTGSSCGGEGNFPVTDQAWYLRATLQRFPGSHWECVVRLGGTWASDTNMYFALVFEAADGDCPPASGWSLNSGASAIPPTATPDCSGANPCCTAFTSGGITLV